MMTSNHAFALVMAALLSGCITKSSVMKRPTARSTAEEGSAFTNSFLDNQNFYIQAVLQYELVKKVINRYGTIEQGALIDQKSTHSPDSLTGRVMRISIMTPAFTDVAESKSISQCVYQVPQGLLDLNSGFQYRYYLFSGEAKASMQAFGITDLAADSKTQYMIIDYLQYKDCHCAELPTIRYAVGIRSELKITNHNRSIEFDRIGSLADLAAKVQLGQVEVNFSLKTIGITGSDSRLSIPQGVSFDVTTYKDFQNTIEFVKKLGHEGYTNSERLNIQPEIVPVLDDYHPNLAASIDGLMKELEKLGNQRKRVFNNPKLDDRSREELVRMIDAEIESIVKERAAMLNTNTTLNSLENHELIIQMLSKDKIEYGFSMMNALAKAGISQDSADIDPSGMMGGGNAASVFDSPDQLLDALVNPAARAGAIQFLQENERFNTVEEHEVEGMFRILLRNEEISPEGMDDFIRRIQQNDELDAADLQRIIDQLEAEARPDDASIRRILDRYGTGTR